MARETESRGFMPLIVERISIGGFGSCNSYQSAVVDAAAKAEMMLYRDILGALQFDSGREIVYPDPKVVNDGSATWGSNWFIPPYEYERGIRWSPLLHPTSEEMQFAVKAKAVPKGKSYRGVVDVTAFVWDSLGSTGCLVDLVNRNKDTLISAETARILIPSSMNSRSQINKASISGEGSKGALLWGFTFPPNEIGDISYTRFDFMPVDLNQRKTDGEYRDR